MLKQEGSADVWYRIVLFSRNRNKLVCNSGFVPHEAVYLRPADVGPPGPLRGAGELVSYDQWIHSEQWEESSGEKVGPLRHFPTSLSENTRP